MICRVKHPCVPWICHKGCTLSLDRGWGLIIYSGSWKILTQRPLVCYYLGKCIWRRHLDNTMRGWGSRSLAACPSENHARCHDYIGLVLPYASCTKIHNALQLALRDRMRERERETPTPHAPSCPAWGNNNLMSNLIDLVWALMKNLLWLTPIMAGCPSAS